MQRTKITMHVLSEDPIPGDMDVADIVRECDVGDYVLCVEEWKAEEISGKDMADALRAAGSEPGFFQLDYNGAVIDP